MDYKSLFDALVLGVLEGLTEFIPVSSTGHLLLAGHFLGFDSASRTFEVVIQLGAILALTSVFAVKVTQLFIAARHDDAARRSIVSVALAFVPAVVVGLLAHDFIKTVLFETPMLIAIMLIVGGVILLYVDRYAPPPKVTEIEDIPLSTAFKIGVVQCLAMIPGVSRSGATIVGAMMMGVGKRAAAEFSFFLSMPTMAGAFAYDLMKNRDILDSQAMGNIVVGFVCAFIAALIVVKWLLNYVSKHGYALFAWWRIIVGTLALLALAAGM